MGAALQEPQTAAEVMARVRRVKAVFDELRPTAPAKPLSVTAADELSRRVVQLQLENATLQARLKEYEAGQNALTITAIQKAVCKHFSLTLTDIRSHRRTASLVLPRQVAMFLCRTLTLHSLPEIARMFGGRDHTTALHAVRRVEDMRSVSVELDAAIKEIIGKLPRDTQGSES